MLIISVFLNIICARNFTKNTVFHPGKYLREIRISNACRLLTTNDNYTLQKIAQSVGYSNDNYFGKVFKAEKGISPAKIQEKIYKIRFNSHCI